MVRKLRHGDMLNELIPGSFWIRGEDSVETREFVLNKLRKSDQKKVVAIVYASAHNSQTRNPLSSHLFSHEQIKYWLRGCQCLRAPPHKCLWGQISDWAYPKVWPRPSCRSGQVALDLSWLCLHWSQMAQGALITTPRNSSVARPSHWNCWVIKAIGWTSNPSLFAKLAEMSMIFLARNLHTNLYRAEFCQWTPNWNIREHRRKASTRQHVHWPNSTRN